ncbi:UNVERIFIED_CONTAM: Thylakoid lumenal protein, chloroplastic [Sesamum latifolium]|uniref:Thylakoid lumenal protein, chloroplastic n=1 Tax=Sesamum latifolium TaxID=2727402 RepID=A0AAW2YFH2_9LAMI
MIQKWGRLFRAFEGWKLEADSPAAYKLYYGTAASAANYGGYGGNSDKKASAEYIYDVPDGWKEKLVSKIQKGTNGTDSEFYNPKKKAEKEYLTFLEENVVSEERKDEKGQLYYVYEIDGIGAHSLISVTCAKNKLYAHFVNAPTPDWNRDQETLRHIHESFKTVG